MLISSLSRPAVGWLYAIVFANPFPGLKASTYKERSLNVEERQYHLSDFQTDTASLLIIDFA
jgi:hypothetical protein